MILSEADYERALGVGEVAQRWGQAGRLLGDGDEGDVFDELPRVLAAKVRRMVPDGFRVTEIELAVEIGGSVFGLGLSGNATIKFGPGK